MHTSHKVFRIVVYQGQLSTVAKPAYYDLFKFAATLLTAFRSAAL